MRNGNKEKKNSSHKEGFTKIFKIEYVPMDNMSQSTPAHQLVTKETAPLINKPRRGGILLGFALFRFCFGFSTDF